MLGVLKALPLCGKKFKRLAKAIPPEFGGDAASSKIKGVVREQERALLAGKGGKGSADGEVGFNGFSKINGLSWDDSLAALPLLDKLLSTR